MYEATVEGGSFKSNDFYGWARNTEKLNSKSSKDFRWSVRLNAGTASMEWIAIGIAAKLEQSSDCITEYDENAILYHPYFSQINKGKTNVKLDFKRAKPGDEIHFRFQPKSKKFSISFVSSICCY